MKKSLLPIVVLACTITTFIACDDHIHIHDNNTNISISDSDDEFRLSTRFSDNKTSKIRHYIDESFGDNASLKLGKGDIDATITLDDKSVFYIKSTTGRLTIEMDKNDNTEEAYHKMKEICNGVKDILRD